ncbi:DUF6124 family protein [Pseudomonas sp. MAFF 311095]|uniref:DUF6124 family protein n=1 Tax=Pseudomonas petroselini TaxID=2899822 RepID=A0ABS8R2E8_9PSED|nr:DUF6124 family protein [Pseudomonas petroselini]MCD7042063.1 DUF6124 family protein [Pseudomonas petroselini]MCD7049011.1 DUF6124 family protein [Pseudomonas petroselini]MCD7071804.1 DUF6124 family protein [Pseudomonas petroselini]MCD7081403.1 DUF6124 family protein [Pseudomonas petroselini]
MFKPTPNPPPSVFTIADDIDDEALMINSFETFSSVSTLLLDLSEDLDGKHRDAALAIHQLSALGTLMVSRMLDRRAAI